MRTIRISEDVKILWRGDDFRQDVFRSADKIAFRGAQAVSSTAASFVQAQSKRPTGHLAGEIVSLKSKFQGGGAVSWAQAPGHWTPKYHASFVELGTKFKSIFGRLRYGPYPAKPYMRPAADMLAPGVNALFVKMFRSKVKLYNRDRIRG